MCVCYLGEMVEGEELSAVVVAMATLVHQSLQLERHVVLWRRQEGRSWRHVV